MVKNTVIVPVGAKGGFVVKNAPAESATLACRERSATASSSTECSTSPTTSSTGWCSIRPTRSSTTVTTHLWSSPPTRAPRRSATRQPRRRGVRLLARGPFASGGAQPARTRSGVLSIADQAEPGAGAFDAVIHNDAGCRRPSTLRDRGGAHSGARGQRVGALRVHDLDRTTAEAVYLSSGMHRDGDLVPPRHRVDRPSVERRSGVLRQQALRHAALQCRARRWPDVLSNTVDPGWVPTRMGGPGASDDLGQGHLTQVWAPVSDEPRPTSPVGTGTATAPDTGTRVNRSRASRTPCSTSWERLTGVELS